ncbi:hypothetical protein ES706_00170 [subsurface metagenome]|nr:hypothetical protein [Hadesarchaea archaeon]
MNPEISVPEWEERLAKCIKILRTHDAEMKHFFGNHVFIPLKINKGRLLDKDSSDLRMLFFFTCTTRAGGVNVERIKTAMDYFNAQQDSLIEILNAKIDSNVKFERLCEIVYPERSIGVGQKIGSLFLELLVVYGGRELGLLPFLYLPIDTNVWRIFTDKLGVPPVELPKHIIGYKIWQPKFRTFQEKLRRIAEAHDSHRIHFDYLWYVGHICGSIKCIECWLQSICLNKEI